MKRLGIVAIIFALALFGVSTVSAQMYDGSISGVVTDQDSGDSLSWSVVKAFVVDGPNWPAAIAMTTIATMKSLTDDVASARTVVSSPDRIFLYFCM